MERERGRSGKRRKGKAHHDGGGELRSLAAKAEPLIPLRVRVLFDNLRLLVPLAVEPYPQVPVARAPCQQSAASRRLVPLADWCAALEAQPSMTSQTSKASRTCETKLGDHGRGADESGSVL
eukprot:1763797-Rhodomonas_salina.4